MRSVPNRTLTPTLTLTFRSSCCRPGSFSSVCAWISRRFTSIRIRVGVRVRVRVRDGYD